jgi:hypothetical protein
VLGFLPTPTTHIEPEPIVVEVSVSTTSQEIKDPEETYPGEECNCYLYTKNRVPNLPRMSEINPNAKPFVGGVAIEWFKQIKHVSVITKVTEEGVWVTESNYHHCQTSERFIPFTKPSLVGFWVAG